MTTKELSKIARDIYNETLKKIFENPEVANSNANLEYVLAEVTKLLSQELSTWLWENLSQNTR